ncbi:unnamed protein product [Polarella glacialis]|uniref:Potassium channel domain-containing protein n=1 Tax=Polarella glacialis TaxID=89957 RepID=A0A813GCI7_POLGL|nr:unnamed protein product [Polarella glacialis]
MEGIKAISLLFFLIYHAAAQMQCEGLGGSDAAAASLVQRVVRVEKSYESQKSVFSDDPTASTLPLGAEITENSTLWDQFWFSVTPSADSVKVYDDSQLPRFWQLALPTLWAVAIGSAPLFCRLMDGKKITQSEQNLATIMWVTLFGGIFMFTNIILFNSSHWSSPRVLTGIECIYFMATCLSTVGYGDIYPARNRGKVFVGLYIVGSLFVLSYLLSQAISHLIDNIRAFEEELQADIMPSPRNSVYHALRKKVKQPSLKPVFCGAQIFAFFAGTWVVFMHFVPGEDRSWLDSIYSSLITMSSVGFGAVTPLTQAGMAFASVWMILGTASLANLVGAFGTWLNELQICERLSQELESRDLQAEALQKLGSLCYQDEVSECEFALACLWSQNLINEDTIHTLQHAWKEVLPHDAAGDGRVPFAVIKQSLQTYVAENKQSESPRGRRNSDVQVGRVALGSLHSGVGGGL